MDESLLTVRDSVIQGLGELTDFFGFSPIMGHLYGALIMSPGALSLDELESIVGKSKASVSMNMRALERWGMVREVWVKGDRRKFYEAEDDFWKIVRLVLESRERREVGVALQVLENNITSLNEVRDSLSDEDAQLAEHYLNQVQSMRAFFRFAEIALEFFLARSTPVRPEELGILTPPEASE